MSICSQGILISWLTCWMKILAFTAYQRGTIMAIDTVLSILVSYTELKRCPVSGGC